MIIFCGVLPLCVFILSGEKRLVTLTGQATVSVVSKREADDKASDDDCVIYRYGSFCTGIEVFGKILSISAALITV